MTPELPPKNAPAHKTVSPVEASVLLENWDTESPANSAVSIPTVFSYFSRARGIKLWSFKQNPRTVCAASVVKAA